jgi:phosphatidylinositol alpha-1,6-mannosyltransferase
MFARMRGIAPSTDEPGGRAGRSTSTSSTVRKPRLLVLTPDFPPARGGIQLVVHRLAAGIESFETKVVALSSPGADRFDANSDLAVRRVGAGRLQGPGRHVPLNAAAVLEALSFRPQIILNGHIVTSPASAAIQRVLGARTVQYFHAKEIGAKPRLAAFAARQAHAVIAVSAYTSSLIADSGASQGVITLIPPGVDLPSDPRPQPSGRPTFLTIARLEDRYKGHDVLIGALALVRAKVPDVAWIVIGDGPLRGELEELARSTGVADAVRFLGSVSDEERDSWLRRADLLAMPSRLPGGGAAGEGFGIVYLEAAAYRKPVVAGNVAGALDSVADGVSGLLADPSDPLAVADAISTLLLDPGLARRLGSAGAERARSFAWPVIVKRVEAVLLEQLAESRFNSRSQPVHEDSARTAA